MDVQFVAILQKLIAEQGKEGLLTKGKSFLGDYTGTEYKKERRLFVQALETGTAQAIDRAGDLETCKKQQVRLLHEDYFLDQHIAADLVDTLAFVLRGDTAKTAPASQPSGSTNTAQGGTSKTIPGFVFVQGGTFLMGSNSGEEDEKPVHTVTVGSFYLGTYQVTQQEYEAVMGNNPSKFKGANLPVEQVSWLEAIEYCNKLSVKEGLTLCYRGSQDNIICNQQANGYRLPTEAEWEYAAKEGDKAGLEYKYSGSNSADSVAWYKDNSGGTTHPVGTKQPNSLGIYDLSGNVWEWCWDWYGSYSTGSQTDPTGASSGSLRVLRGGSWLSYGQNLRSAIRYYNDPSGSHYYLGFRVVRPSV